MERFEKIKKELDSFIKDGLTGGFHFDEESALELTKIQSELQELFQKQVEKNNILTEQLDISQDLHKKEFEKVRRYEKALYAILNIVSEQEQDGLIDIITDTLGGFELMVHYEKDSNKGKELFKQMFNKDK